MRASKVQDENLGNSQKKQEELTLENFAAIKNLDIKIKKGEFVCIIGDVGSGKSSLLSALIGDLLYLPEEVMSENKDQKMNEQLKNLIHTQSLKWNESPVIELSDNISYVQQVPWIQNKTIRENITFG